MKKTNYKIAFIITMVLVGIASMQAAPLLRYVKVGGTGDGTSWATASGDLQAMVDVVDANTEPELPTTSAQMITVKYKGEVLVAAGTYTGGFIMKNGVLVYGGYPAGGGESRNIAANQTILDGGFTQRVLSQYPTENYNMAVRWDGFTIQRGQEDIVGGAGAYVTYNGVLANCIIRNNKTTLNGGGVIVDNRNETSVQKEGALLFNCVIVNNTAGGYGGGAYHINGSSSSFINCTIANNDAAIDGTGIYVSAGGRYSNFFNCIFWGNTKSGVTDETRQLMTTNQFKAIQNCYIQSLQPAELGIAYSEYGTGAIKNITFTTTTPPSFVNSSTVKGAQVTSEDWDNIQAANWRLQSNSPCINTGNAIPIKFNPYYASSISTILAGTETNAPYAKIITTDIVGTARVAGAIDLGAYEIDTNTNLKNTELAIYSAFPNPVTNQLKINGLEKMTAVSVFDISGKHIKTINYEPNSFINVNELSKGIYFIRVQNATLSSLRFVKQ